MIPHRAVIIQGYSQINKGSDGILGRISIWLLLLRATLKLMKDRTLSQASQNVTADQYQG